MLNYSMAGYNTVGYARSGDAEDAIANPAKYLGAKLIRFGPIRLD